jgi:iron complex outermembrane recepter protein
VLAQPSDTLKIRAILDAGQDDSEIVSPRALGLYGPAGGFCAEVQAGYGSDNCLTWQQLTTGSGLSPNLQSKDATRVLADPFGRNDNDTLGATLIADIGVGDMTLTSVSGYRDFDFGQMQESDGIPGEFGHQVSGSFFKSYSQEFRLASSPDGALTWIIGANYARDTLEERRKFLARDNAAYAAIFGSPLILGLNYDQESKAWATYGQADYALTDTLTLSGALRYTQEEKSYTNGTISFPGVPNIFGTPLQDDYELDSPWSGKVSLGWKPVEDTLIYASVSRGFKSGGFFGGFALKGQAAIRPYTEELVNAYEIGTKNTFLDRRVGMNLSMFYYDYQDVQSFATEWDEILGTITRLRNVGDAEHVGVELESYVVPVEGLRLAASVGYLDAKIQDSPNNFRAPDGQLITYDGYQRVFAPEWSWTAQASYELPIGAAGSLRFAADANGRSTIINPGKLVSTGQESLVDRALHRIPGYKLVNGRISFQAADGDWEVALWGRNLLDESYKTVWGGDGLGSVWQLYGEPMSYGVEATLRW